MPVKRLSMENYGLTLGAGTQTPLKSVAGPEFLASDATIQNPAANAETIWLGGATVTDSGATMGIELLAGSSLALAEIQRVGTSEYWDFRNVFCYSVSSQTISVTHTGEGRH